MNQEVIQNFLNLPGIVGVALMDGRSRPYFCGVDQTLNFQQKEALAQGILQVVETIPEGFESFEFQFSEHQVHIYKLDPGTVLLVLTHNDLVYSDYLQTIKNLKAVLREDIANGITVFRLLAGQVTLPGLPLPSGIAPSEPGSNNGTGLVVGPPPSQSIPPAQVSSAPSSVPTQSQPAAPSSLSGASNPTSAPPHQSSEPGPEPEAGVTAELIVGNLEAAIAALNQLSQFTTHYLGNHVIVNYWKSTRPPVDWLTGFQIDRSAQFSLSGTPHLSPNSPLTQEQQGWLQEWVAAFIKRCAQVIRNFPGLVDQKALNPAQKALLLKTPP